MDEDNITITDANYREPMDDKMSREMKEYSAEKLRRAEEKENEMLERAWEKSAKRAEKRKKFFAAIKKIFVKANTQTDQKER
ncbi:MAG: hypothetical protein IKB05_00645 [Alphaproteobacteria bacterium]|nr:hypothetical protein [Alphaproteobacteria bacterium]